MSTDWLFAETPVVLIRAATGFPDALHPSEADLFCRQAAMPRHRQDLLDTAHVVVVGCGGLGSWIALALARMGVRALTLIDPDRFDRTNAPRQIVLPADLGAFKAHAVAANIEPHMTNRGAIRSIAQPFAEGLGLLDGSVQGVVVSVDNNATRLEASGWARIHGIAAVFVMLSRDGLRAQSFRQDIDGPCLSCVLPDLDPQVAAPCAAAAITSCYLAASHGVQMLADAIMGGSLTPSWRETSLDGSTERIARPTRRADCDACARG